MQVIRRLFWLCRLSNLRRNEARQRLFLPLLRHDHGSFAPGYWLFRDDLPPQADQGFDVEEVLRLWWDFLAHIISGCCI